MRISECDVLSRSKMSQMICVWLKECNEVRRNLHVCESFFFFGEEKLLSLTPDCTERLQAAWIHGEGENVITLLSSQPWLMVNISGVYVLFDYWEI